MTLLQPLDKNKIAFVYLSNGRQEFMKQSIHSFNTMFPWGYVSQAIAVEDTGLEENRKFLTDNLPPSCGFQMVFHDENMGLAAAVNSGWSAVSEDIDYIFHMEDDFIFNISPNIKQMKYLLDEVPNLTQVALKCQPVNDEETKYGGFMSVPSFEGIDCKVYWDGTEITWIEHRSFFTLNPSLIPRSTFEKGWPIGNEAEMKERLYGEGSELWGAYLGGLDSQPKVNHVGHYRSGDWKL